MSDKGGRDEPLSVTTPEKLTVFYLNKDIMMIKNRTKFVLIAGIGFSLFSGLSHTAFEKKNDTALVITNLSAPARLGPIALIHNDKGFSVIRKNGKINEIPNHLVASLLRRISQNEVKARLDNHIKFRIQQGSDGEFSLQECGGLDGGVGEETKKTEETMDETIVPELLLAAGLLVDLYEEYISKPTIKQQREDNFNQTELDYTTCIRKNPLEKDIEGTYRIPSVCLESFNKFKIMADVMKMRKATRLVENEHNAQQVRLDSSAYAPKNPRLDFEECLRQNPLAEGTVGIPFACIGQFNRLKTVVDAMNVREDTTQN